MFKLLGGLAAAFFSLIALTAGAVQLDGVVAPGKGNERGYTVDLNTTHTAATYTVGPAYPTAKVGFELGADFVGTLYACDTVTYAADTCDSIGALSADFGPTLVETHRKWYLLTVATPESSDTAPSTLTIYGSYDYVGAPDPVKTLIGGEGSVSDVADPNSTPIVCPKVNAACFYLSSTTGWWAASTSDGTSATTWSPISEVLLYEEQFEGDAGYNIAAFSTSVCLQWHTNFEITSVQACTHELAKLYFSQDVYITKVLWVGKVQGTGANSQTATDGCTFKFSTGNDGSSDLNGDEYDLPSTSAVIADGELNSYTVGTLLTQGTPLGMQVRDGDFCQSGTTPTTCNCDASWGWSRLEIWGVRR